MTSSSDRPDEYESIRATVTLAERELLLKTFGVPLHASNLNKVQLQFLVTHRRIRELESESLGRLKKPPASTPDEPN